MENDESGQDSKVVHDSLLSQEPTTSCPRDGGPSSPALPPRLKSRPSEAFDFNEESLPFGQTPSSMQAPNGVSENGSTFDQTGNCRHDDGGPEKISSPQHLLNQQNEKAFFQIVFRGVVSLLHAPDIKSGVYLGYAEIFEGTVLELDKIRVDRVLTGAYAVDSADRNVASLDHTPKRTNTRDSIAIIRMPPMPLPSDLHSKKEDETSVAKRKIESRFGYVLSHLGKTAICVPVDFVPHVEEGEFIYTVVSSNAIPIRTGPALDAPCTTGTLMPGTSHEVCLRVLAADRSLFFLRLARRRGWIMEKRQSRKYPERLVRVMQEMTDTRDSQSSKLPFVPSSSSSSIATPISQARRRHRPPRRYRDMKGEERSRPPTNVDVSSSFRQGSPNSSFDTSSFRKTIRSPSLNKSMLSEESALSLVESKVEGTPERQSTSSPDTARTGYFLIRVTAPRGLKILDAPHFQVNNLIHGKQNPISSTSFQTKAGNESGTLNQSIFQTMTGYHTTALTSKTGNPAVFDSVLRARKLPRGCVFEASKRMESTGAFGEGDGLIKLSDNSGWAIVPKQEELDVQYKTYSGSLAKLKEGEATRAFEEVGNAFVEDKVPPIFMRVHTKGGITVSCPPAASSIADDETSITSPGSSVAGTSAVSMGFGHVPSQDSDMTSSVGSSFIDAMFRTPKKKDPDHASLASSRDGVSHLTKIPPAEKALISSVIPCGMYFQVDPWIDATNNEQPCSSTDFARIRGGQGWIPRSMQGKAVVHVIQPPTVRFGSFWFRVSQREGIKVRKGPSRRAPSIRREDGVYFRFECGEYLRASEVVTFSRDSVASESFAKLYRNRHVRLQPGEDGTRTLASLTLQSEWVQVSCSEATHLRECSVEPRIERQHRQGWRYNVVLDAKIKVRRGPSFEADTNDIILSGGETVLVNERVMIPGDTVTWLRLRDGKGWVHNVGLGGEVLMIPHTLKHRRTTGTKQYRSKDEHDDIAYNTIVARLFHNGS